MRLTTGSATGRDLERLPTALDVLTRRPRWGVDIWTTLGLVAFAALLLVALFGERIAPHEAIYFVPEHGNDPRPYDPGIVFPLGSDVLGRDLLSLVLAGARTTLTIVVIGGLARVLAGVLIAAVSSWWRPTRLATESIAELVSAVPATLVALLLVKVFVKSDTSIFIFVSALLVMGWAGPYRVIRAEADRLAHAPFTLGAQAMGVGRWYLFRRHHLPHLVPVIAMNLSQQIVASLVLVAELGVLSVFVGGTRLINLEESLSVVRVGPQNMALIADSSEWGGLLAGARTVEALWTTRWLILVPGVALALTAVAVAVIGFALARRYARRDVTEDLHGPGAAVFAACVIVSVVGAGVLPERYAAAREWASAARAEVRSGSDTAQAFAEAGLRPIDGSYAVGRQTSAIVQTGPATARFGGITIAQEWPRVYDPQKPPQVQPFVSANTGGGVVEAPLVFAARGIVPSEHPTPPSNPFAPPDLSRFIKDHADDYAGLDVRGKVVLLVRFMGVDIRGRSSSVRSYAVGPSAEMSIAGAIRRGAAAVLFVDPALPLYSDGLDATTRRDGRISGGLNPYLRVERESRVTGTSGVPVIVLSSASAKALAAPLGLDLSPFLDFDEADTTYARSASRDLSSTARVEVPLAQHSATVTSYVGEVPDVSSGAGHVLVWAVRSPGESSPTADVAAALARAVGRRQVPFILVDFDPSVDPKANAEDIKAMLKDRSITLVVILEQLEGTALRFTTPYGDLIPALDLYADKADARHEVTRSTPAITALSGIAPFLEIKTVLVRGNGVPGDLRPDAAAFVGYLAGRFALGAEELPR